MFKNRKLSEYKIKKILWHFCVDVDATKTSQLLSINRNTINNYYNSFREAIYLYQLIEFEELSGEVELDESYFGAKRIRGNRVKLKRGRGTLKQPVFGIFERNGRVYTEIVPDCQKKTLQDIILGKVKFNTDMFTDGWAGYNGLVDVGYDRHYRVNHGANEFSKGNGVHVNGIESFWSFCKRRLAKFNGVKVNFELHLKECEFRWDRGVQERYDLMLEIIKKYGKWI